MSPPLDPSNDTRDHGTRFPAQATRYRCIPRGSTATTVVNLFLNPISIPILNPNPPFRLSSNYINGGDSNYSSAPPKSRAGGNNVLRGRVLYVSCQPLNQRKDRVSLVVKGLKDSTSPQLVQEIPEKLTKGAIECMICYDMVRRSAPFWSCMSCHSTFHLACIKKWALVPASVDLSLECPGCQSLQFLSPTEIGYICFCGKTADFYLMPHSCGEPCGKPLERELGAGESEDICPHKCVLQCHPGPCPPCKAFALPRLCPCGKKTITTRCSDRKSVLTCGQRCDKLLKCKRHRCEQTCHVGSCDPRKVSVDASCFCKKKMEVVLCGDMSVKGEVKTEEGLFSFNSTCGNKLTCGNHACCEVCHPGSCGECDLMPSRVNTCYRGKTSLQEEQQSCLDPIPTCSKTCDKLLPCGMHKCTQSCHAGDCPPCLVRVSQKCRCGSTSQIVECYKTVMEEKFTCDKPCGRKKNCGRHRCSEQCCPLSNSNNFLPGDWDPHTCSIPCGKKLRCGLHSCKSLCHSGHCPPCLETIFTDLSCACGRTSIPPPLPCGTPHPSCQLPCSVPQPCGHSNSHSCHFGDCPPCTVPIAKECIGGHVVLRNIPCGSKDIRCNQLCGKTRQCGLHACGRTCHAPPCDTSPGPEPGLKTSCGQTCGAPRRDCRHTCKSPCHPSSLCPDERCDFPVTITCSCGRITATVPCDAGGNIGGFSADTLYEASIIQKLPVPLQPVEASGKKIPLGQRKLMCDDECAKLERKRVLADAFDVNSNLDALHFGENSAVSEILTDLYRRDPKWVLSVEERCKFLVLGKSRGTTSSLKVHVFCPMLKDKRDAVRLIADRWKLAIYSAGWEPKRFIVVHVTPKSKPPPHVIGVKGSTNINTPHSPAFDPLVDMDPRLVSFLDLPRDSDISALVLRFGGECELVWLNDKNALAVFSDPARAATAMRRLDHGSVYHGAVVVIPNGGAVAASSATSAWGGSMATTVVNQNQNPNPNPSPIPIPIPNPNPPLRFSSNYRNGGDSNSSSAPPESQAGGNNFPRGRGYGGYQPLNPRKDRESQVGKGLKDLNLPQLVQEIQEKLTKGTVECMICYDMVWRSAPIWSCSSCYSIFHLSCIRTWAQGSTSDDLSAEKSQGFNWRCPGCQLVQLTSLKEICYICFCGKMPDPPSDLYLMPHSCGEPCGKPLERTLGAGESEEDICPHNCVLQCHPGPCPPCKALAPPRLCPCGKKTITPQCSDQKSVTCGQRCDKLLECERHRCERTCHLGSCDPCQVLFNASCFCKKKMEVVLCGGMSAKGEVKTEEGLCSCNSTCGNKLTCGNHACCEVCHPGSCGECDLMPSRVNTCYCGKTSLQEERQSCLDPIPTCSKKCDKLLLCGMHNCTESCHAGDCPPCLDRVSQKCRCGSTSRIVECYKTMMEEKFTCDKPCGRKKNCGRHRCSERCCPLSNSNNFLPGDWDPHTCSIPCGRKLRCGLHSCQSLCHRGHCPPCPETIFTDLWCACGRTSYPSPFPCGTPHPPCQFPCSGPQHSSSALSEILTDLCRRDRKWVLSVEERYKFLVLGKSRGTTSSLKVHVFCPMLKDNRDAVGLIADRWKLAVYSAGLEPKRFIVVHVTPKSKPPPHVIGVKGSTNINTPRPPAFDPLVDMDPRLLVSFLDLPRDADISALILRFVGECELVWLNDKNALAVFSDPALAARAVRILDHGSVYHGAVEVIPNGGAVAATSAWGGASTAKEGGLVAAMKGNPGKKVVQEPDCKEDLWGDEEWPGDSADLPASWKKEAPIAATLNRWSVLDSETTLSSSSAPLRIEDPGKQAASHSGPMLESEASGSNSAGQHQDNFSGTEMSEVVDDWEKAYE